MVEGDDPRAEERLGSVLADKWTLERLLGIGGMGAVYAARHRNGARAAVKLLHPELARNQQIRERFLREGYAANKVEHRCTVQVLDDDVIKEGPDEGAAYLVMELLEGESLDERRKREPKTTERELLEIMDAVLDVLDAAHARGVVHRDLKPDNLFLAKDPDTGAVRVKVLDFGLARLSEAARMTGHGLALGTPAFMSPEQAAGLSEEIDGRVDIFALGATVFYVFTGQHVHDGETVLQLVIKMAKDQAPGVQTVRPDTSDDFAAILDRALQLERANRYPSAAAMRDDVREALAKRGGTPAEFAPVSVRQPMLSQREPMLSQREPMLPPREPEPIRAPMISEREPERENGRAADLSPDSARERVTVPAKRGPSPSSRRSRVAASDVSADAETETADVPDVAGAATAKTQEQEAQPELIALPPRIVFPAPTAKEDPPPVEESDPALEPKRGGFPFFRLLLLVAAGGALWFFWPELRARFDSLGVTSISSSAIDAAAPSASQKVEGPDATPAAVLPPVDPANDAASDALATSDLDASLADGPSDAPYDANDDDDDDDDDDGGVEGGTAAAPVTTNAAPPPTAHPTHHAPPPKKRAPHAPTKKRNKWHRKRR
jgi:eukaryotic-like serine/threonine-protein kinase